MEKCLLLCLFVILVTGSLRAQERLYHDPHSGAYLTKKEYVLKYGKADFNGLVSQTKISSKLKSDYTLSINPVNVVVGTGMIGVSLGAFAISNSVVGGRVKNLSETDFGLASLTKKYSEGRVSKQEYDRQLFAINLKLSERANKIESLEGTGRVIGYVCGGVSVIGVIVLIAGLHKEYKPNLGYNVKGDTYINSSDVGVTLSYAF